MSFPIVRSHERMDYKRCPKKWYWKWRRGLVPKTLSFGALSLGTWIHQAFANWYALPGTKRVGSVANRFMHVSGTAILAAHDAGAPDHALEKADELAALGLNMMEAYDRHYGTDPDVHVIHAELPLEFTISDSNGRTAAIHRLKPDLVYHDPPGDIWLMEHKSARQIRTEHLVIDDQARPYGVLAERGLKNAGVIGKRDRVKGIMYNYIRKGQSDTRETNEQGQALNKDGSVSKRQPSPLFLRHPVFLTRAAKLQSLRRIQTETVLITQLTQRIRTREIEPQYLPKTPHHSCPRTCDYFGMCVAEENGTDIRSMERMMYVRQDPYLYETTDEPAGFEMG